jgi:hypothetical protein
MKAKGGWRNRSTSALDESELSVRRLLYFTLAETTLHADCTIGCMSHRAIIDVFGRGNKLYILPLLRTEPLFVAHSIYSLVSILTELHRLKFMKRLYIFLSLPRTEPLPILHPLYSLVSIPTELRRLQFMKRLYIILSVPTTEPLPILHALYSLVPIPTEIRRLHNVIRWTLSDMMRVSAAISLPLPVYNDNKVTDHLALLSRRHRHRRLRRF